MVVYVSGTEMANDGAANVKPKCSKRLELLLCCCLVIDMSIFGIRVHVVMVNQAYVLFYKQVDIM